MPLKLLALLLFSALLLACQPAEAPTEPPTTAGENASPAANAEGAALELNWEDLIPPGYEEQVLASQQQLAELDDLDPRAIELMKKLREQLAAAPVVPALDNSLVKIPGFVVPLISDGDQLKQFLLVPYYGACIHEPPPPANQTLLVDVPQGTRIRAAFDTVWVTGRLKVVKSDTDLAVAGYQLTAAQVETYQSPLLQE